MRNFLATLLLVPALAFGQMAGGVMESQNRSVASLLPATSAQLRGILTDETGTGVAVFSIAPSLIGQVNITPVTDNGVGLMINNSSGYGVYQTFSNTFNFNYGQDADTTGYINYLGYNSGTSRFRSLVAADGKQNAIATFDGPTRHTLLSSVAPVIGACGTSPSVTGSDHAMLVTVGTGGSATSCAVTFGTAWTTAPVCVAQNTTDRVAYSVVTTGSAVTITATAAFTASSKFHVLCMGS